MMSQNILPLHNKNNRATEHDTNSQYCVCSVGKVPEGRNCHQDDDSDIHHRQDEPENIRRWPLSLDNEGGAESYDYPNHYQPDYER